MRVIYREELDEFSRDLVNMCDTVRTVMDQASDGLITGSLSATERALSAGEGLAELKERCEQRAIDLLARQTPLASDLRQVVTSIYIVTNFDRMGALAMHVADLARNRHPEPALVDEVVPLIVRISALVQDMAEKVQDLLEAPDADAAVALAGEDDAVDELRDELVAMSTLRPWPHEARYAADTVLLARFYERYGDHCVSVASRMVYLTTGLDPETYLAQREGEDALEEGYWPESF